MAQARINIDTRSGFLQGSFKSDAGILLQDAGRTEVFADMTIVGKIVASGKLVPIDPTAADGSQHFAGVYHGYEVPAADMVAGDVDLPQVVEGGNGIIDEARLVLEDAVTLDTAIGTTGKTIRDEMKEKGLWTKNVTEVNLYENA